MNFAGEAAGPAIAPSLVFTGITSVSGASYGIGFSSTALTTEKIAMLTPMPSVSARTAVAVNTGFSRNDRQACLMSLPRVFMAGRGPSCFSAGHTGRPPRRPPVDHGPGALRVLGRPASPDAPPQSSGQTH